MNIYVGDEIFRLSVEIRPQVERRIETMLAKIDRSLAEAFAEFLTNARSDEAVRAVANLIAAGRIDEAADVASGYSGPIGLRIAEAYRAAALFEVESLKPAVAVAQAAAGGASGLPPSIMALFDRLPRPSVGISFDPSSPRAVEAMRSLKDEFLTRFNGDQRETIRATITAGLETGAGPREVAREIRKVIGLTSQQAAALERYRALLRDLSSEALTSPTRDRRYDATVRKATKEGRALDADKIEEIIEARRRKMLRYRSEQIAINESARALNLGREEGLRQMVEASGIDPALVTREWRSVRDSRVRDTHIALDGQKTGLDGVFLSPSGALLRYPRDPKAPSHETAGCRCYTVHKIARPKAR